MHTTYILYTLSIYTIHTIYTDILYTLHILHTTYIPYTLHMYYIIYWIDLLKSGMKTRPIYTTTVR